MSEQPRDWTFALLLAGAAALSGCEASEAPPEDPELTSFKLTVESLAPSYAFFASGVFDTPVAGGGPGPLEPGASYAIEFYAPPGARLSFASMLVPSNDLFFAPTGEGIALFDDQGQPRSADVTAEVSLWDAGTELDEPLGLGPNQAPNQAAPNTGEADDEAVVRPAADTYPDLPAVDALIAVTLSAGEGNAFTLTIENRSDASSLTLEDDSTIAAVLAPGVFVIHTEPDPLFEAGSSARAAGLEALAEDGDPDPLTATLGPQSGVVSLLAPGLWWVHESGERLFVPGEPDPGLGLEALAEDGDPAALEASLAGANIGVFGGVYGDSIMPLPPNGAFILELEAAPGDRLSLVSMYAQSNDVFLATAPEGIALFDEDGELLERDISAELDLWDAGTELNEAPGAGSNQAPRQAGPDTGPDEGGVVRLVDDGFAYPAPSELVRIIVTAGT